MPPPRARGARRCLARIAVSGALLALFAHGPRDAVGQGLPAHLVDADGASLYAAACANCHGADGAGASPALLGFEEEVPDFTDCSFSTREPDADWIAVAHEGGPVRGFSAMMPSFGGLLDEERLQRIMAYVRTLCADDAWPRGELNLPRAFATEKAYPEDEAVLSTSFNTEGRLDAGSELVYERRLGARHQIEVKIPFGVRHVVDAERDAWASGIGDLTLGFKTAIFHSLASGSILSVAGEVKLPTGDSEDGFGSGTKVLEGFVSFGQILPADAFVQLQAGGETPTRNGEPDEVFARGVVGRTLSEGRWGRAWTPMVELVGSRERVPGEEWAWDWIPQMQVTLNTRQHVMVNVGARLPLTEREGRDARVLVYVLWDWFDGGFFEGW